MAIKTGTKTGAEAIPKILRRNAIHQIAFGFIAGRMKCSGITFCQATEEFLQHFGLHETNPESLEREVRRMIIEYLNEGL